MPVLIYLNSPYVLGAANGYELFILGTFAIALSVYGFVRGLGREIGADLAKGWKKMFAVSSAILGVLGLATALGIAFPSLVTWMFVQIPAAICLVIGMLTMRAARLRGVLDEGSVAR